VSVQLPPKVLKAFDELAGAQRGEPEKAMLRAQHALGGGVYSFAIEHAGDITHRGWKGWHLRGDAATSREYMDEKVGKVLRSLRHPYGFEREHAENMVANASYRSQGFRDYKRNVDRRLQQYAEAHMALPVYNEAQLFSREAAVALGLQDTNTARHFLGKLETMIQDPVVWEQLAKQYRLGPDGYPMEIKGTPSWRRGP